MSRHSTESLEPYLLFEKKHFVIWMISWEIAQRVYQIMQGKQDQKFLESPLEQRYKDVLKHHANESLFTWFHEQYMTDSTKKHHVIQSIQLRTHEAILCLQQGKTLEDLYMSSLPK